jgi:hypothetical protein
MAAPVERIYRPDPRRAGIYDGLYARYRSLGAFEQARATGLTFEGIAKL